MKRIIFLVIILSVIAFKNSKAQVGFVATDVCFGSYSTLVAQHPGVNTSAITYWCWYVNQYNDSVITYGDTLRYLFPSSGNFPVRLKIVTSDTSYSMMSPVDVYVRSLPNANFTVGNACQGLNTQFQSTSTIGSGFISQYKWDFNNDGVTDFIDNQPNPVSFNFGSQGMYITRLEVVSDQGCVGVTTRSTEIFSTPEAEFSVQNSCQGDNTMFNNLTTNGPVQYFLWDFGDGQSGTSNGNISHQYDNTGNYNTRLIAVTSNNCKDTFNLYVAINPKPSVFFSFPNGNPQIYEGGSITVTATGDFNSLTWSNGQTSNPVTLTQGGHYTVTVTNNAGCNNTGQFDLMTLSFNGQPAITSNVLTPNGDGVNETFIIENVGIYSKCEVSIYTMYGERIYISDYVYQNTWNGDGRDEGAYYYIIDTDQGIFKGCINILK